MASVPRSRKRVHAPRRAPDGSAFQECDFCGDLVAVALYDMHYCEANGGRKKRRFQMELGGIKDQPRSPFCCFMESFWETCKGANRIVIDRRGFNAWKNMSAEERHPYVVEAERVNSAYEKKLLEEISDMSEVDDEADSATIRKFDKQDYKSTHGYYGSSRWGEHKTLESFDSYDWEMMKSWIGW